MEANVQRWVCTGCGYVYDPRQGDPENDISTGTPFEDLPEDWCCPLCYLPKEAFDPE